MAGGIVVATWITYALSSAWWFGSSAREVAPYVYAPLLVIAGVWLGRRIGRDIPARVLVVVLTATAGWLVLGVLLTAEPGKAPTGYPNANAALAVQLIAIAGLVGLCRSVRTFSWQAIALALIAVLANRSAAAAVVAVPLILTILLAMRLTPARRRWPAAVAGVTALTATTVVLVSLARRAAWPDLAVRSFDEVRQALWLTGWEAFRTAEAFGRGPGAFEDANPFTDPDVTSAHSLPIQIAVELGGLGLALLILLYLCGLGVALSASTAARSWIAVAGWTALSMHAFVDHLLEYWPIPLAAGLALGYGLVAQPDPEPQDEVV